ncbi:MAG TPA: bifunctional UDP-sugar hydrolase/5'-nucleotidase [Candidatus Limnocylindria bacterium]|nr:bifunctional UDP-sugar hydrolase/5'-nucleotidase [Candidatus Limnocylindria bacterium]
MTVPRALAALLALALVASCSASVTPAPSASAAPSVAGSAALPADRIQLLHTDDIHGRLDHEVVKSGASSFEQGGMATLAAQVADLRSRAPERTLLLDGGDAWQGTFISNTNKGEAVTRAMSLMRYDAMAVGNHEFDWGQEVVAQRAKEASFPFLGANVIETATGRPPAYLRPYIVKDVGIAKVGVIGISNPGSNTIVKASGIVGLKFGPAAPAIRPLVAELARQVDIIVVVAHIGAADAAQLARDVPGIDVIVAGHDHIPLQTARVEGKTTIVNSGAYTQFLGRLEIIVDPVTRKMTDAIRARELVAIAASAKLRPDPEIAAIVAAHRGEAEKYTSRVVGTVRTDLPNPRDENGIGNMITDAFVEYGRQQGWKTDVAFYNAAGVRAPLAAGPVTFGQLYQVLPFGNTIVSVDLTGGQLREVLEDAAGRAGRLQIGGGSFAYRFANPAGQRVLEATIAGQPLDPGRVYHVATIDYLLLGGDGHTWFGKGTNVIYGDVEVDVVAAYMTAHSPLDPRVEGRIQQR